MRTSTTSGGAHTLTLADQLADDQTDGVALVSTRGAGNARLLACIPFAVKEVILWPQNDQAGEKWLADAITALPTRNIRVARTPKPHKDLNEWTQSGAAAEEKNLAGNSNSRHSGDLRSVFVLLVAV